MFIQIIQGRCTRPDELKELISRWGREMAPGVEGWLGGTYGFTDDGMFVGVVRFDSPEAARANSDRPEQGEWARQMSELFDGPVEYHDCEDVTMLLDGGSDDAGFVQIIRGKVDDADKLKALMRDSDGMREARPDVIGGTLAIEADGTFTETIAFTDEATARRAEKEVRMPEQTRQDMEAAMHDVSYLDLHHPWFASASRS